MELAFGKARRHTLGFFMTKNISVSIPTISGEEGIVVELFTKHLAPAS